MLNRRGRLNRRAAPPESARPLESARPPESARGVVNRRGRLTLARPRRPASRPTTGSGSGVRAWTGAATGANGTGSVRRGSGGGQVRDGRNARRAAGDAPSAIPRPRPRPESGVRIDHRRRRGRRLPFERRRPRRRRRGLHLGGRVRTGDGRGGLLRLRRAPARCRPAARRARRSSARASCPRRAAGTRGSLPRRDRDRSPTARPRGPSCGGRPTAARASPRLSAGLSVEASCGIVWVCRWSACSSVRRCAISSSSSRGDISALSSSTSGIVVRIIVHRRVARVDDRDVGQDLLPDDALDDGRLAEIRFDREHEGLRHLGHYVLNMKTVSTTPTVANTSTGAPSMLLSRAARHSTPPTSPARERHGTGAGVAQRVGHLRLDARIEGDQREQHRAEDDRRYRAFTDSHFCGHWFETSIRNTLPTVMARAMPGWTGKPQPKTLVRRERAIGRRFLLTDHEIVRSPGQSARSRGVATTRGLDAPRVRVCAACGPHNPPNSRRGLRK